MALIATLSDDSWVLAERGSQLGEREGWRPRPWVEEGAAASLGRRGRGKDAGCQSHALSQLCSQSVLLFTFFCQRAERNVSPFALWIDPEQVALPGLWLCRAMRGLPGSPTWIRGEGSGDLWELGGRERQRPRRAFSKQSDVGLGHSDLKHLRRH